MYDLSISLVVYKNDPNELCQTIESVLSSSLNLKLFVVDNSPTDELKCFFNRERIEYSHNSSNVGFGAGHNIAISKIRELSKFHLILNPDIYFENGVLEELIEAMKLSNIGLLMPKVINPDGSIREIRRLLPKPINVFGKLFGSTKWFKNQESIYRTEFIGYDREISAPFLSGCFMLIRTSEFDNVGVFDERFFMYFEDVDLSRRFYSKSYSIYYPRVSVVHLAHRESSKNLKLFFVHVKSAIQYFNKWGWFDRERRMINKSIRDGKI